jgi:excinuclease ABC subunit C
MKITGLPDTPGVYLFMDSAYTVVYVGKAKSVKNRVRTHFGKEMLDTRHMAMISQVRTVDYITTKDEREALVLEDQLIKNLKPRYNIALRDDKTYPYLELTAGEKFPALNITRRKTNPDSVYFGPFPKVKDIRAVKRAIDRIFPMRKCAEFKPKKRPCLNFQMKTCCGPCAEKTDEKEYAQIVEEVKLFLLGKQQKLLDRLKARMEKFKQSRQYENAAMVRDQIRELEGFNPMVSFRKISRKKLEFLTKMDPMYLLKDILSMKKKPDIIEGFDISHISATQAAGGMVYFKDGEPDKSGYRKFKIRQPETADDLRMLEEVVFRRLSRLTREGQAMPDIILVDGGRGQEKAVRSIVEKFGLANIRVLALAKEKDNVYYRGRILPIEKNSELFKLLKKIDDEAHRFAHSYHVLRRKNKLTKNS